MEVSDELVEQRILEAFAGAGDSAVVTGWAALRLLGGGFFDGLARDGRTRLPVPVAANGGRIGPRAGVALSYDAVPEDEIVVVCGVRCAVAERALFDEIRRSAMFPDQVVAADMAFAGELTSIRRMRRYRWTRYWYRDIRRLDRVLPWTSEHARSRPEVDFRLVWVLEAGWATPLVNREVLDLNGGFVGIPDLLDVRRGVAGEFAGAGHRDIDQHEDDLERAERVLHRMDRAEERAALRPQAWQLGPSAPDLDGVLDRKDAARRHRDAEIG